MNLLASVDLVQHVIGPTHRAGHTLDVVITQSFTPVSITIEPPIISYHLLVVSEFFFGTIVELRTTNTTVSKRDWKALDMDAFRNDLLSSTFFTDPPDDVSALFNAYDQTLHSLVDKYVPAEKVVKRQCPSSPLFNHRSHIAKVVTWQLERRINLPILAMTSVFGMLSPISNVSSSKKNTCLSGRDRLITSRGCKADFEGVLCRFVYKYEICRRCSPEYIYLIGVECQSWLSLEWLKKKKASKMAAVYCK